jgi:hypothetical protein
MAQLHDSRIPMTRLQDPMTRLLVTTTHCDSISCNRKCGEEQLSLWIKRPVPIFSNSFNFPGRAVASNTKIVTIISPFQSPAVISNVYYSRLYPICYQSAGFMSTHGDTKSQPPDEKLGTLSVCQLAGVSTGFST